MKCGACGCAHHKAFPVLVVLFGLTFLLHALGYLTEGFVAVTWPVLVLAAGALKLGRCKCC